MVLMILPKSSITFPVDSRSISRMSLSARLEQLEPIAQVICAEHSALIRQMRRDAQWEPTGA